MIEMMDVNESFQENSKNKQLKKKKITSSSKRKNHSKISNQKSQINENQEELEWEDEGAEIR